MRWIIRLLGVVVLVVIVGLIGLMLIPTDRIARVVEARFEAATGRALDVGTDISPKIFPTLGVTTGAVSVANADWAGAEPMVRAEGVTVGVNLRALIGGVVEVESLTLTGPVIRLTTAADGRANWEFESASGTEAAASSGGAAGGASLTDTFTVDRAEVTNARLIYTDGAAGTRQEVSGLNAVLRYPEAGGALRLTADGSVNGAAASVDLTADDGRSALSGAVTPLSVSAEVGGNPIRFTGRAGFSPLSAEGALDATVSRLAGLMRAAGQPDPGAPAAALPLAVKGNVTYAQDGSIYLRETRLGFGKNTVTGAADVIMGGERPNVTAQLTARALDLSAFLASDAGSSGASTSGSAETAASGWSRDPIDVSALGLIDGQIALKAESIDLGDAVLSPVDTVVRIDRSRMVFDLREIGAFGGRVGGEFVVNGRGGLSSGGTLSLANVRMQDFLTATAGVDRVEGLGNGTFKFLAVGNSMAELTSRLSGEGRIALTDGKIRGVDLASMLRNLDKAFGTSGAVTDYTGLTGSFAIEKGVLQNTDLLFGSDVFKATGTGQIDIGQQTMNYRITPETLERLAGLGGIKVPVVITGPWSDLKFRPDLKSLIDEDLEARKKELEAEARAKLAEEEAALRAEAKAKEAELRAKVAEEEARAKAKAAEALGVATEEGESLEDAARRKVEEELRRGLGGLLGGN